MKKYFTLLLGYMIILIVIISLFSQVTLAENKFIIIDNSSKSLIAPEACNYQWYKNGQLILGASYRSLPVTESGNYEVKIKEETGKISVPKIAVSISATGAIIKIYTIGDSTVSTYNAGYYPQTGWGQVFGAFFNTANVQVINKAVGGTSSKSFYNNQWPAVRSVLEPGDYVFIQFGINDATHNPPDPNRDAAAGGEFNIYLKKFISDTKAKGAIPILVSTLRRNAWNTDGTPYDAYHLYPAATRTVAAEQKVALVDLDARAKALMTKLGQAYVTRFWYLNFPAGDFPIGAKGDNVHFQEMGAIEMARLVTEGIRDLSADPNVSKLIPNLKPTYEIAVAVNPKGSDQLTTRTASYPQGLTVTLRTVAKTGGTFQKWNNASGTSIATNFLTKVTSGSTPTSYTAIYKGAIACNASISTTDPTTICQGGSTLLTAANGTSYIWKNGNTQVGTSKTYKASSSGAYTVEVTDDKGCKATSAVTEVKVSDTGTWYGDADKDGMGDSTDVKKDCVKPEGYVAGKGDLCPLDAGKTLPGACGCGQKETSNCTLAIENQYQANTFSAYPNPFQGEMFIVDNSSFNYRILSVAGQELDNGHINNTGSIGGKLLPGIYILEIIKESGIKQIKISKK